MSDEVPSPPAWPAQVDSSPAAPLGRHLLADFHGVSAERLSDAQLIESTLHAAARAAGATPLHGSFHHFGAGQGVTGVLLLRESHISIHTWPEHGFAALDVFMCGSARPERAIEEVRRMLAPQSVNLHEATRGGPGAPG